MSDQKTLNILNLLGELSESVSDFFSERGASIYTRNECEDFGKINVAIVGSAEQAVEIDEEFNCSEKMIQIICIGEVDNVKEFMVSNGRLQVSAEMFNQESGKEILHRYFNQHVSIHLDEIYGASLKQIDNVKVINHLAVGESLDQIAVDAFDQGFNIVSIRSFLDHAIFYFTYLRQAGLAGIPFEVEYGHGTDKYVVNIHATVKNFVAEYLMESFGNVNSKKPLYYLLSIVKRSCDLLEVTYIESAGKVAITGVWNDKRTSNLSGLIFNNIKTTAQTLKQIENKIKEYKDSDREKDEAVAAQEKLFSKKLPGGLVEIMMGDDPKSPLYKKPDDTSKLVAVVIANAEESYPGRKVEDLSLEEVKNILNEHGEEELVTKLSDKDVDFVAQRVKNKKVEDSYLEEMERVRSEMKEDEETKKVLGETLTEEVAQRVTGQMDAETLNRLLNGGKENEDDAVNIKGSKDEADNFVQKIKSTPDDEKDKLIQTISGSFEEKSKGFNVKIGNGAIDDKKGLFNFVSSVVSSVDELKDLDLNVKNFVKEKAPEKIERTLESYAKNKRKKVYELTDEDLYEFNKAEVPKIIKEVISTEELIQEFKQELEVGKKSEKDDYQNQFEFNLKNNLKQKLEDIKHEAFKDGKANFKQEDITEEIIQEIIKDTMHQTIKAEYQLENASREVIEEKEKKIVEDLSTSLALRASVIFPPG